MNNKTIWKFKIEKEVIMPKEALILRVGMQNETPYLWAMVDPGMEREKRSFIVLGTGNDMSDSYQWKYVDGFTMENNGVYLEWHVFEVMNPQPPNKSAQGDG